jgi:hypothetical protein
MEGVEDNIINVKNFFSEVVEFLAMNLTKSNIT